VSELRLSLRVRPSGLLGAVSGPRTVHLDIVDYPGEWLLDLALLDLDFEAWSRDALARAETPPRHARRALLRRPAAAEPDRQTGRTRGRRPGARLDRLPAAARAAGFSDCTPGRFLLPGDLEGSPAITFAPLPPGEAPRGSLAREFARRYEAYKREVVKPFFRAHFARIDRQIVLVDALGAIHAGPPALEDLRQAMARSSAPSAPAGTPFSPASWAAASTASSSPRPRPITCTTTSTPAFRP
jgi:predicted YcjX-like family ATPase